MSLNITKAPFIGLQKLKQRREKSGKEKPSQLDRLALRIGWSPILAGLISSSSPPINLNSGQLLNTFGQLPVSGINCLLTWTLARGILSFLFLQMNYSGSFSNDNEDSRPLRQLLSKCCVSLNQLKSAQLVTWQQQRPTFFNQRQMKKNCQMLQRFALAHQRPKFMFNGVCIYSSKLYRVRPIFKKNCVLTTKKNGKTI